MFVRPKTHGPLVGACVAGGAEKCEEQFQMVTQQVKETWAKERALTEEVEQYRRKLMSFVQDKFNF